MQIAIAGATGQLGRLVLAGLAEKGLSGQVVALARDPAKLDGADVTVRAADYNAPDTLAPALAGVQTLLLISGSEVGQRVPQHKAVIDTAKAAGVTHIVYTSLLRADTSIMQLAAEHKATEELIRASGLTYTFLRNGWYTENYTGAIGGALQAGAFIGSAGEGRISGATRADYAAAAVAVLTGAGHENKVYELAGDTSWTLADLAAEVSAQTGRDIPYTNLPPEEYANILVSAAGLPEMFAQFLAGADVEASKGALESDSTDLRDLIGRPTTPLAEAVKQALAA